MEGHVLHDLLALVDITLCRVVDSISTTRFRLSQHNCLKNQALQRMESILPCARWQHYHCHSMSQGLGQCTIPGWDLCQPLMVNINCGSVATWDLNLYHSLYILMSGCMHACEHH
jgi:hypothetical protein